jgi:hypothetical protein
MKCDRACPLCGKEFAGIATDTKKALAKHVKEHSPDPENSRLKSWLSATNRSWCVVCLSAPSNWMKHICPGDPSAAGDDLRVAAIVSSVEPVVVTEDVKSFPVCSEFDGYFFIFDPNGEEDTTAVWDPDC